MSIHKQHFFEKIDMIEFKIIDNKVCIKKLINRKLAYVAGDLKFNDGTFWQEQQSMDIAKIGMFA